MRSNAKPNFTAWFVMQGTIAAMWQPDLQDIRDDHALALYRPLSEAASKTRLISRLIHRLPYAWQYRIGSLVTHPDRLRHFCFRKKEIEKQARQLLDADGIEQVIILGAGLDVLSLRLAAGYPAVKFIEIDTGESQDFKVSSFRARQMPIPANVEFITGDLREPLSQIVKPSALHDARSKTLWIAEGLFMFIPQQSVLTLLKDIREHSAAGSFMIFTSLSSYKPSSWMRHALQALYLHKESSAYQWVVEFKDVPLFMTRLGYQPVFQMEYATLQQNYAAHPKSHDRQDVAESIHVVKT